MEFSWVFLLEVVLALSQMIRYGEGNGFPAHTLGRSAENKTMIEAFAGERALMVSKDPSHCDQIAPIYKWKPNPPYIDQNSFHGLNSTLSMSSDDEGGSGSHADDHDDGEDVFDFKNPHHEYATISTKRKTRHIYHGASAFISTWQPWVEREEERSLAQIWVSAGKGEDVDVVEAGWEVYPRCYTGDKRPHLFVFMTNDSYNSVKCLNTLCHDTFIRSGDDHLLGQPIDASTSDHGIVHGKQFQFKMAPNGDWHLSVDGEAVGYWPARVLPRLSRGATEIQWGGEILTFRKNRHTKTQMGNGRSASEGDGKAAYFQQLGFIVANQKEFQNANYGQLKAHADDTNCYSFMVRPDESHPTVFYGGPGYGPSCRKPAQYKSSSRDHA